jgi:hypothetical protein
MLGASRFITIRLAGEHFRDELSLAFVKFARLEGSQVCLCSSNPWATLLIDEVTIKCK